MLIRIRVLLLQTKDSFILIVSNFSNIKTFPCGNCCTSVRTPRQIKTKSLPSRSSRERDGQTCKFGNYPTMWQELLLLYILGSQSQGVQTRLPSQGTFLVELVLGLKWELMRWKVFNKIWSREFPLWHSGNKSVRMRVWSLASRSVGRGSSVAMGRGVGWIRGSDPTLLWLWQRLAAVALIRPLAWELPYAVGVAQ